MKALSPNLYGYYSFFIFGYRKFRQDGFRFQDDREAILLDLDKPFVIEENAD